MTFVKKFKFKNFARKSTNILNIQEFEKTIFKFNISIFFLMSVINVLLPIVWIAYIKYVINYIF